PRRPRPRRPHPETGPRSTLPPEITSVGAGSGGVDVAEGTDQAAGALVGLAFGGLVAGAFGSASGTQFRAALARRVGFGIEGLGDAGRPAGIAEPEHGHFEQFGRTLDLQRLAAAQRARRLGPLAIDFDLAVLDRLARQAARLEEARRP